ncbi:IS3 family transposase [Gracilibacillus phocaeensis]|uniref:IS3 family transposase n=1 Tax=Gracilibacillus phocaeensis TaxID=2042304 RepID=UPI0013EF384E|nr:IS3 family transposase [Gracilibacillus phocaeensis]
MREQKELQFAFIEANAKDYPVTDLVELTDVSRAGYYKWKNRGGGSMQANQDEQLYSYLWKLHQEHRGTLGRKRMKIALKETYDIQAGEMRVARIMRQYGLRCKIRQKRYMKRHDSHHKVANILDRNFHAEKPGCKFAIDITYLPVQQGVNKFLYLCAIKDLFHDEVVAYALGPRQDMALVYEVLEGLKEKTFVKGAILHSDQGTQFTNAGYQMRVQEMGLTPSMSRRGNCWDNACIENFFSHAKCEMACFFEDAKTASEVQYAITEYIHYYNHKRIHTKLQTNPVHFIERWEGQWGTRGTAKATA